MAEEAPGVFGPGSGKNEPEDFERERARSGDLQYQLGCQFTSRKGTRRLLGIGVEILMDERALNGQRVHPAAVAECKI